jgi:hypothetical protein
MQRLKVCILMMVMRCGNVSLTKRPNMKCLHSSGLEKVRRDGRANGPTEVAAAEHKNQC